jgi:RHS repeat-associated protein
MGTTTTANPITPAEQATVPALRLFQIDTDAIGRIADGVNLFRGDVSLPLELLAFEGRGGLEIRLSIVADSNVRQQIDTWNLEAPTGLLGLGWSMAFDQVIAFRGDSVSPFDNRYYLISSDGSRDLMVPVKNDGGELLFELERYRFWRIVFDPATSTWRITTDEGVVKTYGGGPAARQSGVLWGGGRGNWSDASIQAGQGSFDLAWSLSRIENLFGDSLELEYDEVDVEIGPPGQQSYTRASYLTAIVDPSGRRVDLRYGEKVFDGAIREYEAPHRDPRGGELQAFQDRFETRFLDSIVVSEGLDAPEVTMTLRLSYSLAKLSQAVGDPRYLWKRYLRSIQLVDRDGGVLPGMTFDYQGLDGGDDDGDSGDGEAVNLGALKRVTYPEGGVATYAYASQPIAGTELRRSLSLSDTGTGVPRIWFGADYTVVTRYDSNRGRRLTVNVYDWNGSWIGSQPLVTNLAGELDLETLVCEPRDGWFLLSGRTSGQASGPEIVAWAINRRLGRFADWRVERLAMPSLSRSPDYQIVAGASFVAAAADEQREVFRYRFDPRARGAIAWVDDPLVLPNAGNYSLGAFEHLLTLCDFSPSANQAILTVLRLSQVDGRWSASELDRFGPVLWKEDFPKLSWALQGSLAAATYLISEDPRAETVDLGVRLYTWNRDLAGIERTVLPQETRPVASLEPFAFSIAARSLVANAGRLRRYNGNVWVAGEIGPFDEGATPARFAYADDLAIGTSDVKALASTYDPFSGVFLPEVVIEGGDGPPQPTISGRYVTVRSNVYFRDLVGRLVQVGGLPGGAERVANRGPGYLAFQLSDGRAFVHLLENGVLARSATLLPGERLFAETAASGTDLAAFDTFATYTGSSFDEAETVVLYRLSEGAFRGAISDLVVTSVTIDPGLGQSFSSAFEYPCDGTSGPFGLIGQYSMARSIAGGAVPATGPADAPAGYTEVDFFDGRSVSPGDEDLPLGLLSGLERGRRTFDGRGRLVREERYRWEVVREIADLADGGRPLALIGAYARQRSVEVDVHSPDDSPPSGPLTTVETIEYDEGNGRERRRRRGNFNSEQREEIVEKLRTFTYEEYPELLATHVWSPVIRTEQSVDGVRIEVEATTWKPWLPGGGAADGWAPFRTYRARSASAVLTRSDWDNRTLADPAQWWLSGEVVARDAHGNAVERRGPEGRSTSWIYDREGRMPVATFPDASADGGEVLYLGFESYESTAGWTVGGSAERLRQAIKEDDVHAGAAALGLANDPGGSSPLARELSVAAPGGRTFVLSCWVKIAAGAAGRGRWTIAAGGDTLASLDLESTGGAWEYRFVTVELPASGPVALRLALSNATGVDLLVDDVRFSPLLSACEAVVYDPRSLNEIARLRTSGATTRRRYDGFGRRTVETAADGAPTVLGAVYASRQANDGRFDPRAPNSALLLRPQQWSSLLRFRVGEQWRDVWSIAQPSQWNAVDGRLRHASSAQPQKITFSGLPATPRRAWGMASSAIPRGPLTGPFGLSFGSAAVVWDPDRAAWGLERDGGTEWRPPRSLLSVSWADFHPQLDRGELPAAWPELFGAAGLPLAPSAEVTAVAAGTTWRLADPGGTLYYLVRDPADADRIAVARAPAALALYLRGAEVMLFADGAQALSARLAAPISGDLGIVATSEVDFADVAFFTDPQLELDFRDGAARNVQLQVADDDSFLASANLYDLVGRPAIATLLARLDPAADRLATYEPELAAFDWQTFTFSGLVADQHPEAGGFPYSRARYEDSPLGREVERGLPGADLAIQGAAGGRTTRVEYGLNEGALGLAPGKYLRETLVDPDGITRVTLRDQRGGLVRAGALASASPASFDVTSYTLDAAQNLVSLRSPMGYVRTMTYDFLGRLASRTSPNADGIWRRLYDSHGRLRFQIDPRGERASPQYVEFWTYDEQSRIVHEGVFVHPFDQELRDKVDDPSFPDAPPSNAYRYDGVDRDDLTAIGRLTSVTSARQVTAPDRSDDFTGVETLFYDLRGRIRRTRLRADAFAEGVDYDLAQSFDNLDNAVETTTPTATGGDGERLHHGYDLLGRIATAGVGESSTAFAYDLDGRVASESGALGRRTLEYNPAGWSTAIRGPGFSETTEYTSGGLDGKGYFNGSPARIVTAARGPKGEIVGRFGYDSLGRLSGADFSGDRLAFGYDANGNVTRLGDAVLGYAGDDRTRNRAAAGVTAEYGYTADGGLTSRTAAGELAALSLAFDAFRGMPLEVTRGDGGDAVAVEVRYGADNRRLFRRVTGLADTSTLLYLRGSGGEPVAEIGGDGTVRVRVAGPRGLTALRVVDGGGAASDYFVATDALGSVRALTDAAGNLIGGYDYRPYGEPLGNDFGSRPASFDYRFTDRQLDPSGLYDFRARFYDPTTGRFVSLDPAEQLLSPYVYAADSPLLLLDPSGEFIELIIGAIVAAIVEIVKEVVTAIVVGAAVGAALGGVQAVVTIVENDLSGARAAGVFFGFVGLGAAAGAITGGAGGLASALTTTTAASVGVGAAVGTAVGALAGSAQGAGTAALVGGDPGAAAGFGALGGAASGGVGSFVGGFGSTAAAQSSRAVGNSIKLASGAAGGASGSLLSAAAQGEDAEGILLAALKGTAFGTFGRIPRLSFSSPPAQNQQGNA